MRMVRCLGPTGHHRGGDARSILPAQWMRKDSQSDGAADIDIQEQTLLQEKIQKGIAKSPIKSAR